MPFLIVLLSFLWVPVGFAQVSRPELYTRTHDSSRSLFLQAESALASGKLSLYQKLKARLTEYPLLPYLLYSEYEGRINTLTFEEFQAFMEAYPDSPLTEQLRNRWLQAKAKQENWRAFIQAYQPTEDVSLQCYHLWASLKTQPDPTLILKQISTLWVSGKEPPKSCEAPFAVFERSSEITRPFIWQRIKLLIQADNATLARRTSKYLKKSEAALVELWLMVRNNPYLVTQHKYFAEKHPAYLEMIVDGVSLIAKDNPEVAIKIWQQISHQYPFAERHWGLVVRAIGLAFAFQKKPQADKWLKQVPAIYANQTVHEWRIRVMLAKEDWPSVLYWIKRLPQHLAKTDEWQYWHARALEMLNRNTESQAILSELAKNRGYYGFLASHQLLQPYSISHKSLAIVPIETSFVKAVEKQRAMQRARELHLLGRFTKAQIEWQFTTTRMTDKQKHAAARLALQWQLPHWAILAMSKAKNKNDITLRFPVIYTRHVLAEAQKQNIDPAWILAITRQESAFVPHAKNPSGAVGLMQLKPSTAHWVAQKKQIAFSSNTELLEPITNIQLGSGYLRMMLDVHKNNPVLATAAYNAGPGRIKKWLPTYDMAADVWIETIPFKETREYVKNVLTYTVIYQEILGKKPALRHHMPPIYGQ